MTYANTKLSTRAANRKDQRTADEMPLMQHRHFAFIAAVLKDAYAVTDRPQWVNMVHCFADACARSNPKFSRERFMVACGLIEARDN